MNSSTSETEATPNNTPSSNIDKLVVLNVGSQLYIKLDGENYPAWRLQFISLLTGYDLLGYINGSIICPPKHLGENSSLINPAYTHWIRQDQLILHGIISSVAATVVTHLVTVQSSLQAWETLKTMYASRSRVRIMALKQKITTFTKGTQSMAAYPQGVKAIADEIAIIDNPLDSTDLVIRTLNGLSTDYKEISAALCSRETPITYAELHEKLMDFETLLSRDNPQQSTHMIPTAHAATRSRGQQRYKPTHNAHTPSTFHNSIQQVVCQFCERPGHSAKKCYKIHGYPKRQGTRPSVHMATHTSPLQNSSWIMDTGASHHITQDLQQLTMANTYPGSDQVLVVDGSGLHITLIGHTKIPTNTKSLSLKQVLCVPNITTNLVSVSKLCQTNQCSVEFFSDCFIVKDLTSGQTLLQGPLK
ncbi:PREDICTED: uncharacterized protein LOC109328330 [Lupinus angustifolius]|uniref:uncharacterized protein LOC109328330 n=1 Tax=Lupinus angustifolius TaxID=3871 RepID=UPI00092EDCF4|nr:PREDICTED: uncharacterized protein LOC109328330 [Lupinus angustifolius]